jgi:2,3-bisphosphoglycerate-independent phosphoglycerate mutase
MNIMDRETILKHSKSIRLNNNILSDFTDVVAEFCTIKGHPEHLSVIIQLLQHPMLGVQITDSILEHFEKSGEDFRILIMPDHPTPLCTMTHSREPVPYLLYDSRKALGKNETFNEDSCAATKIFVEHGPDIMKKLLEKM